MKAVIIILCILYDKAIAKDSVINWVYSPKLKGKRIYTSLGRDFPANSFTEAADRCANSNGERAFLVNLHDRDYERAVVEEIKKDIKSTGLKLG